MEDRITFIKGAFCVFAIGMYILIAGCTSPAPEEEKLASTPKEAVEMYLEEEGYENVASFDVTGIGLKYPNRGEYISFKTYDEDGEVLFTGEIYSELYME